jgi:uncharacterized protein (TIGR03067 family)
MSSEKKGSPLWLWVLLGVSAVGLVAAGLLVFGGVSFFMLKVSPSKPAPAVDTDSKLDHADAPPGDKENLQGTWALEAVRLGDIDSKDEDLSSDLWKDWKAVRFTFSGDNVVVETPNSKKPKRETYKLNPAKSPKELDIGEGPSPNEYIYRLDGDGLILAFAYGELVAGGTYAERQYHAGRPRDFRGTKETAPPIIWILKRAKP